MGVRASVSLVLSYYFVHKHTFVTVAQLEYGRIGDCVATAQHGRNFARDYMKDMGNDF